MRTMAAPKTALAPVANEAELTAAVTPDAIAVASAAALSAAFFVASAAVVAASFVASAAVVAASSVLSATSFPSDLTTVHALP